MYSEVLWFDCMIIGGWFVVRFIHISYNFVVLCCVLEFDDCEHACRLYCGWE